MCTLSGSPGCARTGGTWREGGRGPSGGCCRALGNSVALLSFLRFSVLSSALFSHQKHWVHEVSKLQGLSEVKIALSCDTGVPGFFPSLLPNFSGHHRRLPEGSASVLDPASEVEHAPWCPLRPDPEAWLWAVDPSVFQLFRTRTVFGNRVPLKTQGPLYLNLSQKLSLQKATCIFPVKDSPWL